MRFCTREDLPVLPGADEVAAVRAPRRAPRNWIHDEAKGTDSGETVQVDDTEFQVAQASFSIAETARSLRARVEAIEPHDADLAAELGDALDSLADVATRLEGIASQWHYVERD